MAYTTVEQVVCNAEDKVDECIAALETVEAYATLTSQDAIQQTIEMAIKGLMDALDILERIEVCSD